jgi:hypothetical protein
MSNPTAPPREPIPHLRKQGRATQLVVQGEIALDQGFGQRAEHGGGLIIALGPDEFLGAGFGFRVRFKGLPPGPALAGIAAADKGRYQEGRWVPGRRLNGDETSQGRWWRLIDYRVRDDRPFSNALATGIGRCVVYRYE